MDMTDSDSIRRAMAAWRPDVVAVPAADPYVDGCERDPVNTRRVNVLGTLAVARAGRESGARVIFFSSDYVLDGVQGVYTEEDIPSPINEYGRQKAETERGVLADNARNLVIRTSGVYGWQSEPKNFALQVRSRLSAGQEMRVAGDVRYNPTFADDLAEITAALASTGAAGIYHVVGADRLSRAAFAARVARAFGLDESLIRPVSSAEFGTIAPRPKESSLRTDKVLAAVGAAPVGVDAGLVRMRATMPAR